LPTLHARRTALAALLALAAAAPGPARALDRFEIQVYQADINEPGQVGFELHSNYTASGRSTRDLGSPEIPPDRTMRLTVEPAVGVTSWLELGAYLQSFVAPGNGLRWGGAKLRAKLVAPQIAGERFFLGANVELARLPVAVDPDRWSNELRPFLGYDDGVFLADLNPILGWSLAGKDALRVEFEPAVKLALNTQRGFAVGVEWYGELGFLNDLHVDRAHYLFGVFDLVPPRGHAASPWEVNVAVGGGVGPAADQHVIVKTIVGRSF